MGNFIFYELPPIVFNMGVTASVAILFILPARVLLKKAPKIFSYALWAAVLFRLLCPVSITTGFSLLGLFDAPVTATTTHTTAVEYIPQNVVHTPGAEVGLPVPGVHQAVNEVLPQGEEQMAADPLEAPVALATLAWMAGIGVMAAYSVASLLQLRRKLVGAVPLRDNIYLADYIESPFVMGIFRPKIYLPSSLSEQEQGYIILHEQHHIRRGDHIVKGLAFIALCVHWFNPLVWGAFILSAKDMEMSCDEAVVKKLGEGIRADYSASLLSLATGRRIIAGTPLAFGEGDTKGRIRNLANWRKPAFWVVLLAVIACIILAVGLMTNPEGVHSGMESIAGKTYVYSGDSYSDLEYDRFTITIHQDGTFTYYESPLSSYIGNGVCSVQGGVLTLSDETSGGAERINYFKIDGDDLVFIEENSSNFIYVKVKDGERFHSDGAVHSEVPSGDPTEGTSASVVWTFSPMMSATWHAAFHFNFDLNYSHIEASCDNGMLWNPDAEGQPREKALRFEAGEPVCWTPGISGETLTDTAEEATVHFTVYDGGEILYSGALEITRTGTENGQSSYEARLGGTDLLALRQNAGNMGASLVLSDSAAIIAYSDLNHNRVNENIVAREVEPGMLYELTVEENGVEIWSTEASPAHTGWNTIMLYSDSDSDYLVRYLPAMFQGVGNYTCTVFSLEGGRETVKEEWSVDFKLPVEETPEMARFAKEVGILLRNCGVLLSTEQGIVVDRYASASGLPQLYPVHFDPEEIQAAIDGASDARELTSNAAQFPDAPLNLVFASGAGGWGTMLTLQPDGSFTGQYSDAEMGGSSPEFPNGTCYVSEFSGRFADIQQISDYAWSMKLLDLTTEKGKEQTWIEDGVRYISAEPYGVIGGDTFILYAPGTPADKIPSDCRDWWPDAYAWRKGEIEQLEGWWLCNVKAGQGFFT